MSYETMKNLVKKWLLEYACKLKYEQVLHLFATTADQRSLDEVGMPQARSLLCTMLTIVTQEDLQHFDIAISVVEQLHAVSTGDVISHNQCIKLLMGLKVSFLAHLLMKGQTQILDKVNKYFPRSPPRRSDIDAKLHKTLEVMNQKSRNFFLSLLANRKMCKNYVRNCFGQEFGPPFMMKLKKLANKFEGEINSCLPPTVIEKIQQSGSNSELIKALSAEKHAVIELFLDLLHSQDTGELKEQISQGEMLDLLQLLKPPADGAKVLGTLGVHWDSIVSDDHSHKSMHPQTDTNNTCWQELAQSEKSDNEIIGELGDETEKVRRDDDTDDRVMARRQKRCSGDASDEDTMSPKKLCRSGKGDRVTTTVPDPDVVTVKSPDNDMLTMTSPDHDSVTLAEPDCDAITFSARDYDTMTSQDCDSVTVIDPDHNSVTVTNHDMVTTTSPDHDMVTTTSPDLDMVTVMSPDHDMVTVTSPDQCTQGRIYKMKAPAPSTHISLVNSQVVSSGTSSSDRSIMSRTTSTQSEGSDSQRLQAHTQSEGSDSQRLQAYTQSESSDSRHIQAHTQSESSDNQRLQAHTQTDGSDSQHLQAHTQSEGTKSQHLQAHTQSEGSSSQRLQTTAVLTQQDRPNEGCVDEEMVLDLSPSTLACHGREEAMYVSFVSDSYSDSNLSKTLLQASDSASSDITTEPMMMFLPPLERHLKHALIRECVVKLHRNKKLDTRLPNQHVELFS